MLDQLVDFMQQTKEKVVHNCELKGKGIVDFNNIYMQISEKCGSAHHCSAITKHCRKYQVNIEIEQLGWLPALLCSCHDLREYGR